MRRIILKQGQSPGDILTLTRPLGDLKRSFPDWEIDVRTPCAEIFENNPHLTPIKEGDAEMFNIGYDEINQSGWRGHHFSDAFRHDIEQKLNVDIKKTGILPELYVSEQERGWINQVETEYGWTGPFWLLNAGYKPDNELKKYHRWQEFVDRFNEHFGGSVRLVQIGHKSHKHYILDGVYNLVGKTDLRQLIRLCWWSCGTIGPLSFQFVMAAAFEKPHVVVAGGKEGVRWHVFPHGRYLATNGALSCCKFDGCWKGGEKGKCIDQLPGGTPRCFDLITPRMILDAVAMYYRGGVLKTSDRGR